MVKVHKIHKYSSDDSISHPHSLILLIPILMLSFYIYTYIVFTLSWGSVIKMLYAFFSSPIFHMQTMKLLALFSYTFCLCSYLAMTNHFLRPCPYRTTGVVIIFSTLIFMFLDSIWEEKGIRSVR